MFEELLEFLGFDIIQWAWEIITSLGRFLFGMFSSIVNLISLTLEINPIISVIFILMLAVGIFIGILKLIKLIPVL